MINRTYGNKVLLLREIGTYGVYNVAGSCRDKPPSCMNKPMLIKNTVEKAIEYEARPLLAMPMSVESASNVENQPPTRLMIRHNEIQNAIDATIDAMKSAIKIGFKPAQNVIIDTDATLAGVSEGVKRVAKVPVDTAEVFVKGADTLIDATSDPRIASNFSTDYKKLAYLEAIRERMQKAGSTEYENSFCDNDACSELRREE